jgi:hypothetical protein
LQGQRHASGAAGEASGEAREHGAALAKLTGDAGGFVAATEGNEVLPLGEGKHVGVGHKAQADSGSICVPLKRISGSS